jgi:hypothetical protein
MVNTYQQNMQQSKFNTRIYSSEPKTLQKDVKGDDIIGWDGHQVVDNFEEQYKMLFPSAFGKWCPLEAFHHSCHATATQIVITNEESISPL